MTRAWDGVWLSIVTMATVGYGDKYPRSIPAKIISMMWMIMAVVFLSTITASITNSITGTSELGLTGLTVAVLKASRLSTGLKRNMPEIHYKEFDTYDQIVEAIENKTVDAAAINTYVAAKLVRQNKERGPERHIIAAYSKQLLFHVDMYSFNSSLTMDDINCYNHRVLPHMENQYQTEMEPEYTTVHTPRFTEVVTEPNFLGVILLGCLSVVAVIALELLPLQWKFGRKLVNQDELKRDVATQTIELYDVVVTMNV